MRSPILVGISDGATTEEAEGNREVGGRASSAGDLELREPPRQDEARRPRLVADPQFRAGMRLAQLRKDLLHGVHVIGDRPVETGLPAPALRERDGDVFGMDVVSDQ